MKQRNLLQKVQKVTLGLLGVLVVSGCMEKDLYQEPTPPNKSDYPTFETTGTYSIDIDLDLVNYPVLVGIYTENPFEESEDGAITRKDINPIYYGQTDASGKLVGKTVAPLALVGKKVYVYSEYVGVPFMEVDVTGDKIQASVVQPKTRAVATRAAHNYPSNLKIIGGWNNTGYPDYIKDQRYAFKENVLYNITKAIAIDNNKGKDDMRASHPTYFANGVETGIPIIKNTKVELIMVGKSAASTNNTIVYFTYPTGQIPTSRDQIQRIVAFPSSVGVSCGSTIQLKYWNSATEQFEEEFPAGVTIGWNVCSDAIDINKGTGDILDRKGLNDYCSIGDLNGNGVDKGIQHTFSLFDKENGSVVIGVEDRRVSEPTISKNYNDVIMYCSAEPGAINGSNMPELEKVENPGPSPEDSYTTYYGELAFEDLWPSQGDYDMNDVAVHYQSKVYTNEKGNILAIEDAITFHKSGAGFANGFGYELPSVKTNQIKSINRDYGLIAGEIFQIDAKGFERGSDKTIIIVTGDNQAVEDQTLTTKIEFVGPQNAATFLLPPYNPFIIAESGQGRGKEVHLTNYEPTALADTKHLGTGLDLSDPSQKMYYVSKDKMPFAIHIPNINGFDLIERVGIDKVYPEFAAWASSNGQTNKDWYLKK